MRKIPAFFFFTLVLISQLGYYGILAVEQSLTRKEQKRKMLSTLEETELEAIPQNPDLRFLDDGKEVYHQGKLYDIVRIKLVDGKRIYLAISDEKEHLIIKKLTEAGKNSRKNNKKTTVALITLFCDPRPEHQLSFSGLNASKRAITNNLYGSEYSNVITPPPNQA